MERKYHDNLPVGNISIFKYFDEFEERHVQNKGDKKKLAINDQSEQKSCSSILLN